MPKVLVESRIIGNTALPFISSHISGTGADHSYIDQNVTVAGTPTFASLELNGNLDMNSNKVVELGTPTSATDGATKGYVDTEIAGIVIAATTWKNPVRIATTVNGALATAFENGDTIDGIVLVTSDRILLKNQTNTIENGIYTVNATGAPSRASDYLAGISAGGTAVIITEGTANEDTFYLCSSDGGSDTVGTDGLVYAQISGGGGGIVYTGGDGIDVTGTVISAVVSDFVGTGVENDGADNIRISIAAAGAGLTGGGGVPLAVGAGDGITVNANDLEVNVGDFVGTGVEDDGTNNVRISTAAAGNGLTGGGGVPLAVGAGDGITVNTGDIAVNVTAIAGTGIENDGSNNARISTAAAGAGLAGGGGVPLAVGAGSGITVNADDVEVNITAIAGENLENDGADKIRIIATPSFTGLDLTAALDMNSNLIINVTDPVSSTDAATRGFVEAGTWKSSVRIATTAAGTLTTSFENGDTVDGVVLVTGNRILIKNQASAIENGIYTVNATGSPTRASDYPSGLSAAGTVITVEEGTANADLAFICTTNSGSDIIGTNTLVFGDFGSRQNLTAGDGIDITSEVISVNVTAIAGTGIENDGSNNARIAAAAAGNGLTGGGGVPLAVGAGDGITVNTGDIAVNVTAIAGTGVENDGADNIRISTAAAGNGLTGGGGVPLAVGAGDGITVNTGDIAVNVTAIVGTGIENDGSNNARIAAAAAGNGLTGGGGIPLAVGAGGGITVNTGDIAVNITAIAGTGVENDGADKIRIATAAAGNGLTGGGGVPLAVGAGDGITVNTGDIAVNVTAIAGTGIENDGSNNARISAAAAGNGLTGGGGVPLAVNLTSDTYYVTTLSELETAVTAVQSSGNPSKIFIAPGTYQVTATIDLDVSDLTIEGSGVNTTVLTAALSNSVFTYSTSLAFSGIHLKNMTIDSGTHSATYGIDCFIAGGGTDCSFDNISFINNANSNGFVRISASTRFDFINCVFNTTAATSNNIRIHNSFFIGFVNCTFLGPSFAGIGGINFFNGDDVHFDRCTFNGTAGFTFSSSERLKILNCVFESAIGNIFSFGTASCCAEFLASGNFFNDTASSVLNVTTTSLNFPIVFTNNVVSGSALLVVGNGVLVSGAKSYISITNNSCTDYVAGDIISIGTSVTAPVVVTNNTFFEDANCTISTLTQNIVVKDNYSPETTTGTTVTLEEITSRALVTVGATNTTLTIPNLSVGSAGHRVYIELGPSGGGDLVIVPTTFANGTSLTIALTGLYCIFEWDGSRWFLYNNSAEIDVTMPTITTSNGTNVTGVTVRKVKILRQGDQITFSATFQVAVTATATDSNFTITLPDIGTTFTNTYDAAVSVNGWFNNSTPDAIANLVGFAVGATRNIRFRFTTSDTGNHYIQLIVRYATF